MFLDSEQQIKLSKLKQDQNIQEIEKENATNENTLNQHQIYHLQ
jgi:hypothetical protein